MPPSAPAAAPRHRLLLRSLPWPTSPCHRVTDADPPSQTSISFTPYARAVIPSRIRCRRSSSVVVVVAWTSPTRSNCVVLDAEC
uniref:Uncharacterized protein n=1 Tax=Leersia perrieri TaxID=77586 RepID=A0A0D9WZS2_9ORYZ